MLIIFRAYKVGDFAEVGGIFGRVWARDGRLTAARRPLFATGELCRRFVGKGAKLDDFADLRNVHADPHAIELGLTGAFEGPSPNLPVLGPVLYRRDGVRIDELGFPQARS